MIGFVCFGVNVRFIGCVGDDVIGVEFVDGLINVGVDIFSVEIIKNCFSGMVVIYFD